ncbi:MAG: peptidase S41 [Sphingomonas sp. 28-66-16]|nr:MAG: peptidase S41 [Sphingomonas sp. 28-66-16]
MTAIIALVAGCGGGGGGGGGSGSTASTGTTGGTPTPAGCSLRDRQDWAAAQLREWYLFPETLPTNLDPAPYPKVSDYVDALTATARAQRHDRYFTYLTSIAQEDAFFNSGSSAGFGIRLSTDAAQQRVFIAEAFEGTAALAAGIDRGAEIVAIGTGPSDVRTVAAIIAAEGLDGVTNALGPNTAGTTRLLRIRDASGTRDVTIAKTDYALTPVSSRYGAQVITDNGRRVGYLNLRTFISTADPALRSAFASFRAQGITNIIVDLRYNGGGLVSIAELMGDLLGAGRSTAEVLSYTTYRPEKSSNNVTRQFAPQPQSVAPTKIAFITTGASASASELVINAFIPYLHANLALIGSNSYGKPVGQVGLDRAACDDRLRVVAFATQNAARQGDYYDGLATKVEASCAAADDVTHPLGDPQEASTRAALNYLAGVSCTPLAGSGTQTSRSLATRPVLLRPLVPSAAQYQVPGMF